MAMGAPQAHAKLGSSDCIRMPTPLNPSKLWLLNDHRLGKKGVGHDDYRHRLSPELSADCSRAELPEQLAALPIPTISHCQPTSQHPPFLWDTGRKNFRTVFGNQDGVRSVLTYRLADFERPFWQHLMRG